MKTFYALRAFFFFFGGGIFLPNFKLITFFPLFFYGKKKTGLLIKL